MLSCGKGRVCLTAVSNDATTLEERGGETETCCPVGREECVSQRCLMTPQRWKKEVVRLKHAVLWGGKNVSHSGVYNDATTLEERR